MTELHDLTAVEQCAALATGKVSSLELTEHYLDRIERLAEPLGAFVNLTPDLARTEAAAADRLLAAGTHPGMHLLGLPIAFKDLQPVAGIPITNGTTAVPPTTADRNAAAVGLIRGAGAVTLGTTHAPEFGIPCYTDTAVVGRPAVVPYDTTRYASGSSGGAAAAVAAGLIPVGHGSDGAGSVRSPAAVCGLVGIKPTRGVVSTAPNVSFLSFSTDGPLARTVADAALLLDAMAGQVPTGIYGTSVMEGQTFLAATDRPPSRPLRLAVWTDSGLVEPHPEVVRAVERIVGLLSDLGHSVVEIANPAPWDELTSNALFDYIASVVSSMLGGLPDSAASLLQDVTVWMLERGELLTAAQFVRATTALAELSVKLLAGVEPFDAVITPVSAKPAVPVGYFHQDGVEHAARSTPDAGMVCLYPAAEHQRPARRVVARACNAERFAGRRATHRGPARRRPPAAEPGGSTGDSDRLAAPASAAVASVTGKVFRYGRDYLKDRLRCKALLVRVEVSDRTSPPACRSRSVELRAA